MTFLVSEYIISEQKSLHRHEYINGRLIEMQGDKDIENKIRGFVFVSLANRLLHKGFQVYVGHVIMASHDRNNFFYPDVFITREIESEANQYIKYEPELIVEVVSPSTHITDTVDKYIAYTTIPSLKYYLIVEPETVYVTLFSKSAEGKWEAMSYVRKTDVIPLPLLEISLPLEEVYK